VRDARKTAHVWAMRTPRVTSGEKIGVTLVQVQFDGMTNLFLLQIRKITFVYEVKTARQQRRDRDRMQHTGVSAGPHE